MRVKPGSPMKRRGQRGFARRQAIVATQNAHQDEQERRAGDPRYEYAGKRKGWILKSEMRGR